MPVMVSVEKGDKNKVVYDYVSHNLMVGKKIIATIFEEKGLLAIFLGGGSQMRTSDKKVLVIDTAGGNKQNYWLVRYGIVCYKKNNKKGSFLKIQDCDYIILFSHAILLKLIDAPFGKFPSSKIIFESARSAVVPRFEIGKVDKKINDSLYVKETCRKGG